MKNLSKLVTLATAATALLLVAGCPKKPNRSTPVDTMGTGPTTTEVAPRDLSVVADPNSMLEVRNLPPGATEDEFTIRNLAELPPIYFEFDRFAVPAKERPKIESTAAWMKQNAEKRLLLEGHCDWRGTAEYNLGLGDRRAAAVRRYLESVGVDTKRLEIVSKGDIDAKEGAAEADMAKDRRVEFAVFK